MVLFTPLFPSPFPAPFPSPFPSLCLLLCPFLRTFIRMDLPFVTFQASLDKSSRFIHARVLFFAFLKVTHVYH